MEIKKENTEFDIIILGKDLNDLMDSFKLINDTHYRLFANKTQRKALERLVTNFSFERVKKVVELCAQSNGLPYAPTITTPLELEYGWSKLKAFWEKRVKQKQDEKPFIYKLNKKLK